MNMFAVKKRIGIIVVFCAIFSLHLAAQDTNLKCQDACGYTQQHCAAYQTVFETYAQQRRFEKARCAKLCQELAERLQFCERFLREQKKQEQERLVNISWMMEACPICFDARASKRGKLIDLTKPEHAEYITVLLCGHVFHTHCIKNTAACRNECIVCHMSYDATDV